MLCLHGFKKVVLVTSGKLLIIIPLGYVHNIRYRMKTDGTELEQVVHHIEDCSGAVAVADPGGGPALPYFLEQTGVQRAETPLPPGRDDSLPPPPPYLTVWIRHWGWVGGFDDANPSLQSWIFTSVLAGCK